MVRLRRLANGLPLSPPGNTGVSFVANRQHFTHVML